MQVQEKLNAMVFELVISNFRGIETFAHTFEKGKPLIAYGENGAGKTAIILALYAALDKRKIPIKYDSLVGPYSIENIKKAKVKLGIVGDKGILELNGKTLEKFYVNFSITDKGSVNLSLTDAITGEVDKSPSIEKIKNLLGLFIDPVDLARTLEQPHGDRNLAEKLAKMVGLDLSPYTKREDELFEEKQEENRTLKRLQGEQAGRDVPQDDWATVHIEPAVVSANLQKYNDFVKRNEQKIRTIDQVKTELSQINLKNIELAEGIASALDEKTKAKTEFIEQNKKNVSAKNEIDLFKEQNMPNGWENSESVLKIEEEIRELTEKAQLYRRYDQNISTSENNIKIGSDREESLRKSLDEKIETYVKKENEKIAHDQSLNDKKVQITKAEEDNKPEEWEGEVDPEGIKTPHQYLTEKMSTVEKNNEEVANRKKYIDGKEGVKLVEESIKDIDEKRKVNTNDKLETISRVDFPMEGITVDENTVWYDSGDGRGKQTILDRSEGEQMRVCTHILIAGNTGSLNVLVIRQGHGLDASSQHIIFEVAAEYGYSVILETIISEEPGAVLIEAGNAKSVIPSKTSVMKEKAVDADVIESQTDPKPRFSW